MNTLISKTECTDRKDFYGMKRHLQILLVSVSISSILFGMRTSVPSRIIHLIVFSFLSNYTEVKLPNGNGLVACAGPQGKVPSLSLRQANRVSGYTCYMLRRCMNFK